MKDYRRLLELARDVTLHVMELQWALLYSVAQAHGCDTVMKCERREWGNEQCECYRAAEALLPNFRDKKDVQ